MEQQIRFSDALTDIDLRGRVGQVAHILCIEGSMSFTMRRVRYNVLPSDYVILPNGAFVSGLSQSPNCRLLAMAFPESLVEMEAIRSNYGVVGHLSLLQNPVLKLADDEFRKCRDDLMRLRERNADVRHLFRDEMVGALLKAHILDLYDIHARSIDRRTVAGRPAGLMRDFVQLLVGGDCIADRSLDHYARQLCITPHYLSDISRQMSGHPATYWIDRFTMRRIAELLLDADLPLAEVADRMHFSSVSYLSRFVKKQLGVGPSAYRRSVGLK